MPDSERRGPPEPPPGTARLRLTRLQLFGLPVLFLVPILALFGLLGEHFTTAHARGAGVALDARYPDRAHYRQPLSMRLHVRNETTTRMDTVTIVLAHDVPAAGSLQLAFNCLWTQNSGFLAPTSCVDSNGHADRSTDGGFGRIAHVVPFFVDLWDTSARTTSS